MHVIRMCGIRVQILFGLVPAMEHVGKIGDWRSGTKDRTSSYVEDKIERDQAIDAIDHRVDLCPVGVIFDLEKNHMLNDGHGDRGF